MDTLAVFRSRSEAIRIYRALIRERIAASTVSTPSRLKLGCGLSVVFHGSLKDRVRGIMAKEGVTSFAGFYPR